jgi:hydrogenase maturation protease
MKTLVVGLGNPILGDDGVGWRVAEEVKRRLQISDFGFQIERAETQSAICDLQSAIEVDCFALGGLSLMERMVGYDRAIVIDAVTTGQPPGTVSRFRLDELPDFSTAHTSAAHDTSLQNALRVGRTMGAQLPDEVVVVGVEAQSVYDFSETLSPPVAEAVPVAARRVLELLEEKSYGLS